MSTNATLPQGWSTLPKGWSTSAPSQTTTAGETPPGFLENLGHTFGVGTREAEARRQETMQHPVQSFINAAGGPALQMAEGLVGGAKRSLGELGEAYDAAKEHNPAGVGVHAVQAIPLVGSAMKQMVSELPAAPGRDYNMGDITRGNVGTAVGTSAQVAPAVLGALDMAGGQAPSVEPGVLSKIPTRAKAGRMFDEVMQSAQNEPVKLTRSLDPLERAQQLSARGHGGVSAVDNLYKRINSLAPLDYREARDWASGLSTLTGEDAIKATPTLKAQVGRVSKAFNEDVGDAAAAAGKGPEYLQAMQDYRRAMTLRKALINTAKVGGGALATGYLAHRLIPAVLPDR